MAKLAAQAVVSFINRGMICLFIVDNVDVLCNRKNFVN